jgi:hypothetical protein
MRRPTAGAEARTGSDGYEQDGRERVCFRGLPAPRPLADQKTRTRLAMAARKVPASARNWRNAVRVGGLGCLNPCQQCHGPIVSSRTSRPRARPRPPLVGHSTPGRQDRQVTAATPRRAADPGRRGAPDGIEQRQQLGIVPDLTGVSRTARGSPRPSTARYPLLVGPPRERPSGSPASIRREQSPGVRRPTAVPAACS